MNLDEAIKHCEEVALSKEICSKCSEQHLQLKEWLIELKELRKQMKNENHQRKK